MSVHKIEVLRYYEIHRVIGTYQKTNTSNGTLLFHVILLILQTMTSEWGMHILKFAIRDRSGLFVDKFSVGMFYVKSCHLVFAALFLTTVTWRYFEPISN